MHINKFMLAIGLTLGLSLFIGVGVAQPQPQATPKTKPKTKPKTTSTEPTKTTTVAAPTTKGEGLDSVNGTEPTKAPSVAATIPPPAPTLSREFKVLSVDALSGLDSLAAAETSEDIVYEPLDANAEKLVNRTKYLAENDTEKALYPLLTIYLTQIVSCRIGVQIAENQAYLNMRRATALGAEGPFTAQIKLDSEQQLSKDLQENSNKCAKDHKEIHDSIASYIMRGGSEPSQPKKEEPQEIKK